MTNGPTGAWRVWCVSVVILSTAACVGWCDLVADRRQLSTALEMRRIETSFSVNKRSVVVRGEDEVPVDTLGWNDRTAILMTEPARTGRVGRSWHLADLATGSIAGPFDAKQFEAQLRLHPELRTIRVRDAHTVWDELK